MFFFFFFSDWGIILHVMATGWTKTCRMDVGERKKKKRRQNCAYRCTRAPVRPLSSTYGGGTRFHPVGPSKVFLLPLFFSNILMSRKYHNIKNKCNPFTKQCAINNNQVVFLYCICTVYTQRVTFVVYMYTKTTGSLVFRLFFFFF